MKLDAAFDTSATRTTICIVNSHHGSVVLETSAPTDPYDLNRVLAPYPPRLHRVPTADQPPFDPVTGEVTELNAAYKGDRKRAERRPDCLRRVLRFAQYFCEGPRC